MFRSMRFPESGRALRSFARHITFPGRRSPAFRVRRWILAAGSAVVFAGLAGCGVYSFSGSTLPGHMKTVDIPLFVNRSMQPDVAEKVTEELTRQVLSTNLLRIVPRDGDATIEGTIVEYTNHAYTYNSRTSGSVDVEQYAVRIVVDVQFLDNKKDDPIYKGQIRGEGIYRFQDETEDVGRSRAVKQIAEQILQNSVQSW